MYLCIICKNKTKLFNTSLNTSVAPMSDKLVKFKLQICDFCGHIQKQIDGQWLKGMRNVYEKKYVFLGRHISIKDNKVVDRNDLIAQILQKKLKLRNVKFKNFLDIGCGAGDFVKSFKKNFNKWNIFAHDLTSLNKKLVMKYRIKKFFQGDLSKIKTKFDFISLNHVLEHLTEPRKIFDQLQILLKSNGFLVLRLPNSKNVHTDLTMLDHCSHFTPETLKNLLIVSGFKIHKVFNNINPIELFIVAKKNINKKKSIKKISKKKIYLFLRNLMWPKEIVSKISRDNTEKKIGLFGVGTSSFYVFARMKRRINFFVDEDVSKIGKKYYGKIIYSPENTPKNSKVYIGIHNKKFAKDIKKRLIKKNRQTEFIVP